MDFSGPRNGIRQTSIVRSFGSAIIIWKENVRCRTPTLNSETVRRMFLEAYGQFMEKRGQVLEDCAHIRQLLINLRDLDTAIATQVGKAEIVAELVRTAVNKNASSDESEEAFRGSYDALCKRH